MVYDFVGTWPDGYAPYGLAMREVDLLCDGLAGGGQLNNLDLSNRPASHQPSPLL